jgi:predicted nucleotidyltransferase
VAEPELAPERLLGVLQEHGVRFVLIGGFAAVIHGSPYVTLDVDVVPERSEDNLRRLSEALRSMHARVWTADEPEGAPFGHDATSLAGTNVWNLVTDHGRLDITFVPSGTTGYEDLQRDAVHLTILGVEVDLASLADVVRSKEAAGREKDRLVLPVLRRILEERADERDAGPAS